MISGREFLRDELDAFGEALRVFQDPIVDQLAGLRLMRTTLQDRRDAIAGKLATAEQTHLRMRLEGPVTGGDALSVDAAVDLLRGLDAALAVAAREVASSWDAPPGSETLKAAVRLHLAHVHADAGVVEVVLQRPPGPLEGQLVDPGTGGVLVEVAIGQMLDAVAAASDDEDDPSPDDIQILAALAPFVERVVAEAVEVRLELSGVFVQERSVEVTRSAAQKMAMALARR